MLYEKCAVCGKESKQRKGLSANISGSPDLDTRPRPMERPTIDMWVETCPFCGYCALDIFRRLIKSSEVVHSDVYQQQLNNPEFPKRGNRFLCYSLLRESAEKYANAAWASIYAAWACDDAGYDASARKCRKRAVTLLQKAKENGQGFIKPSGMEDVIMVDLLRRSGQFESALRICDTLLKRTTGKITSDILRFQKTLISKSDVACHTIEEATGDGNVIQIVMKFKEFEILHELCTNEVKKKSKPICPRCKSGNVIPIVYGEPTLEARKATEEGKIILGGCKVVEGGPNRHCKNCGKRWCEQTASPKYL